MIWGSGGSQSRLASGCGASWPDEKWKIARRCGAKHISKSKCTKHTILGPLLEVEMSKKCTPLWREAHFQVKMYKTPQRRSTFGSCDVEKVHAVVARSTFRSHGRCGAKHISKSTCTKHTMYGPFLEVEMSKKCTPLWREAHFEVEMLKNTRGSDHFWRLRCRFASLHYTTLHYTTLHYITLHYNYTTTQLHSTTTTTTQLHSTTLNYTTLHYTTLHSTTLHYTTLPSTTLHYITLRYTPLQLQLHNYTPLHSTALHSTTLNYTTLHYITLHYIPLHSTTLHYTTLHWMTLHHR